VYDLQILLNLITQLFPLLRALTAGGRTWWTHGLRCSCLLVVGIGASNPARCIGVCLYIFMLCCPVSVEAFATTWYLVQRRPTTCLIRLRNSKKGVRALQGS